VNEKHRFGYRLRFTAKKEDVTIQKLLELLANYCILKAPRAIILLSSEGNLTLHGHNINGDLVEWSMLTVSLVKLFVFSASFTK
jgi:hypothetical protein